MSSPLYSTNEPFAEEIHELIENGMLTLVEIDYEAAKTCESCKGSGIMPELHDFGVTEQLSCPDCRGTGQWINDEAVEWVLSQALGIEGVRR